MVDRLSGTSASAGPGPRGPAGVPAAAPTAAVAAGDVWAAPGSVRPLPGGLDERQVVNSNHPEVLHGPGIALSTLPWPGAAHQRVAQAGDFEVFAHHQNRSRQTLHQAIVLHNPGPEPVLVRVGPSASAVTDDAPYRDTAAEVVDDPSGRHASGPGDLVATAMLRGERAIAAETLTLAPGETRLVHQKAIPPGNEATSQYAFEATGPVHTAVVIEDAPPTEAGVRERLRAGERVAPNPGDRLPTPPGASGQKIYGRVAGVQRGARWSADLGDAGGAIALPLAALSRSWVINAKEKHALGTGQVQTASVSSRYPDAAYAAHGNYGVEYDLRVPLRNPGAAPRTVALYFDTPPTPGAPVASRGQGAVKLPRGLGWLAPLLAAWPFGRKSGGEVSRAFRGTIALDTTTPDGRTETRYRHVSQRLGARGEVPLHVVTLAPGESAEVRLRLRYPANATAPHVLRLVAPPAAEG